MELYELPLLDVAEKIRSREVSPVEVTQSALDRLDEVEPLLGAFVTVTGDLALEQAKAAADGKDVRLGGGVSTLREFLDADLVDAMHVAVVPVEIGRGGKLWDSPDELLDRFHLEKIPSPGSGVTHHIFWRR
jgi:dihydrofolate reductase